MNKLCFVFLLYFLHPAKIIAQENCPIVNQAFKSGEYLNYKIYYNWTMIWLSAGEVSFTTTLEEIKDKKVYHFYGKGETYPKYDWIYKVRDVYESYSDTLTLKPIRFKRKVHEGKYFAQDDYIFSNHNKKIYTAELRDEKPLKMDSINLASCTNDVLSAIYYSRNLDFSSYKINDTIPITFVLDGKIYPSYMRYAGKEVIETEVLGKIRCIKFCPMLIEGTIFKAGEEMTVWATDDKNKIPVYVETPITVGYVKVKLVEFKNLRNKIECIVNQ